LWEGCSRVASEIPPFGGLPTAGGGGGNPLTPNEVEGGSRRGKETGPKIMPSLG